MLEAWTIFVVLILGLSAVVVRHLDKVMDINLTRWSLRRNGVEDDKIREVALKTDSRERRNCVPEVLDRVLKLFGKA